MTTRTGGRASRLALGSLLVAALVPGLCGCSSTSAQSDYDTAYDVGLQAYTYGLPLLETNATFLTMTSVNVTNGHGYGPVNQFNSVRTLNNPSSKAVVAPGASTLSSIAWLDLSSEAQVLHVPEVKDHNFVLALLDPYTEDLRNLGSAHATPPGDYVVSAPGTTVTLPAGTEQIKVDHVRIWIIGSTQLKGPDDVKTVNAIQDTYTLVPLSKYGTDYTPPAPATKDTTVDTSAVPTGMAFLDTLGQQLAKFPPPAADSAQLAALATVGIGPGRTPSTDKTLSADTVRGLEAAIAAGPAQVQADTKSLAAASAKKHNSYFLGGFGTYGTDYQLRAVVAVMGLGAFTSDQAIFASTVTDGTGTALDGSSSYTMHLAAEPPAGEGWTVTVYDTKGALMPNPLNRYNLSNTSALTKNADGSADIVVQATRPATPEQVKNWLPVTAGQGFEVIWRLMAPEPDAIDGILAGTGWQPAALSRAAG
jgi:hypothetical protein